MTTVFVSYSHVDKKHLDELNKFKPKNLEGYWTDLEIRSGQRWTEVIDTAIKDCKVAVFLISYHFWQSDFINEKELPELLDRCERENVVPIFITVGYFHKNTLEEIDPRIREFQWINEKPTADMTEFEKTKLYVDVFERIKTIVNDETRSLSISNYGSGKIHIMTSVKGGVGKTLLSLSIMSSYLTARNGILCADMNTMNTDLYRLLADKEKKDTPLTNTSWGYQKIHSQIYTARRNDPWKLVNGRDFWHELTSLTRTQNFENSDILLDTNVHVANIIDISNSIIKDIASSKRHIYIWIIWNNSSFRDDEAIKLASARMPKNFTLIHVLNPYALLTPDGMTIEEEIRAFTLNEPVRSARQSLQTSKKTIIGVNPQIASDIDQILARIQNEHPDLDLHPYTIFPEFETLLNKEVSSGEISYADFMRQIGGVFVEQTRNSSLSETLKIIYERNFQDKDRKRPYNLLPLSRYDRNLKGYTQRQYQSIDDIRNIIYHIGDDVHKFLLGLP